MTVSSGFSSLIQIWNKRSVFDHWNIR